MGTYRKAYISRHAKGWRYKRAIPSRLWTILGKKEWSKYLGMISEAEAIQQARAIAVEHDKLIKTVSGLPEADRTRLASLGGLTGLAALNDRLSKSLPFVEAQAIHFADTDFDLDDEAEALDALRIEQSRRAGAKIRQEITTNAAVIAKVGSGKSPLHALYTNWLNAKPRRSPANVHHHELHLARFAELIGPLEPRDVKRAHAIKYRDAVDANPRLSFRSKKKQIETLNAMFNLALSDGLVDSNPFHGVKIIQKDATKFSDVQVDRTLTGEQVKLIFDGLERFNMPDDFRWVVWLIAYHGMRSNEAAQLRCEDIVTLHGIPSIRIRDKADGQSLKNLPSVRDIPIHPKCLGIVEYAAKASKIAADKGTEPWVFQSFPTHWKSERRGAWFQTRAVRFLRHQVKITERHATMHSFRHTWISNANVLLMPDKISYAITGHKIRGHHGAYGKLPPVTECLPWLAQIDPLS